MKNTLLLTIAFLLGSQLPLAAQDSIFTTKECIVASVTEISEESIRYTYPNETVVNSINKSLVKKIRFSSGRIQEFTRFSNFPPVRSWEDWESVSITQLEHEIKGLIRLDEVTSKSRGASTISNVNRVKDRAYKKLKIEAAMKGANIVYITDEDVEGNRFYGNSGTTAEAFMSGVAYAESTVSLGEVTKFLEEHSQLKHVTTVSQGNNIVEPALVGGSGVISYSYPTTEGAFVYMTTTIQGFENLKMRVIYVTDDSMTLTLDDKKKLYNFILN